MRYSAVVLAGGLNTRELYPGYQPGYKAALEMGGKRLIDRVLEALKSAASIEQVGLVRPPDLQVEGDYPWTPSGESYLESLRAGLALFPEEERVVIVTADLPLVTGAILDDVVERCAATPTRYAESLHLALVPAERFTGVFARCLKNMNRFRDVALCHGNVALVSPALLRNRRAMDRVDAIYAARLSPIRSALAIGPVLGLAYVLGVHFFHLLTLDCFAKMLSRRFGIGMVPVLVPHPEVAVDIDEPADWDIAKEILEK